MTSLRGKNVSAPRTAIVVAIESGICKRNAFNLWLVGARASQPSCCPLLDGIFQERTPHSCVYLLGVNIYIYAFMLIPNMAHHLLLLRGNRACSYVTPAREAMLEN